VIAPSGLLLDALDATWDSGGFVVNQGVVDGGPALAVHAAAINGRGFYRGNATTLATFGNVNNPVNGARYLANGVAFVPSSGGKVALTLAHYGPGPQFVNLDVRGDAELTIPSAWPPGQALPVNNAAVPPWGSRAAGVPDPAYGGGSLIVQAAGTLKLMPAATSDLAFPGGVVLKAAAALDVNGVFVTNGWTTSGKAFQGIFFESPDIRDSTGLIEAYTNELNWITFSSRPHVPVHTFQLRRAPNGSAAYAPADGVAPHINTYSALIEAAAAGACWICLVDANPVDLD
jgi:hypothetical protein